jgi:hypothetical protein
MIDNFYVQLASFVGFLLFGAGIGVLVALVERLEDH